MVQLVLVSLCKHSAYMPKTLRLTATLGLDVP